MKKRSVLAKMMVIVMLALVVPTISSGIQVACDMGSCQGTCPSGTYDCTQDWIYDSWSNFQTYLTYWYLGWNLTACCY